MDRKYLQLIGKLKNSITETRLNHSINVMNTAEQLALIHGFDVEKAKMAGLLHDCAKNLNEEEIDKTCNETGFIPDEIEMVQKKLLHGPIGALLAKKEYGIDDKEIFDAIYYHTTGRANMGNIEKIIYVADYIEPGRRFKNVDIFREISKTNLDLCIKMCADSTLKYIIKKGGLIHPRTVDARNYYLTQYMKNNTKKLF